MSVAIRLAVVTGLLAAACTNPNEPSSVALRGTLTDVPGDTVSSATLIAEGQVAPDLVSAGIEVTNGRLTITVSYAAGTLSQTRTVFFADFDTDENLATGFGLVPTGPMTSETFGWLSTRSRR